MKKVISIFIICLLFMTGCSVKKTSEVTDEEKFAMEYGVSDDNPFKYLSTSELEELLENGDGIIYFGSSNDESSRTVSAFLLEIVEDSDIDKIYYYDPTRVAENEQKRYKHVLKVLSEKLELEKTLKKVKVPSIYIINKGKVSSLEDDNILNRLDTKDDLNTTEKEKVKEKYINFLKSK